ncbi:MAG: LacI family DNA-binding transcriptional regulator [Capsulimonadales bacterium]|nr:LacI family DNA-binding transcriptional regulator [Capsulimonadales bacterium]
MAVTLKDIAESVGVSRQVVAGVLTGSGTARAGQETRERILAAAREMGYFPNASARSLATGRVRTVELQTHAPGTGVNHLPLHHLPLWSAIAQRCQERHYNLILSHRTDNDSQPLLRNLQARNTDGLILLGVRDEVVPRAAREAGIPALCATPSLMGDDLANRGYTVVNFDNAGGVRQLMDHLVARGHRRIGYVRGPSLHSDFEERWLAFLDGLQRHGMEYRPEWVWEAVPLIQGGQEAGSAIASLSDRPTAILTANDSQALGLYASLQQAGIRVPEDISLVGFDDSDSARFLYPELTTVQLDWFGMGWTVAGMLLDVLEDPDNAKRLLPGMTRLPVPFLDRGSVSDRTLSADILSAT